MTMKRLIDSWILCQDRCVGAQYSMLMQAFSLGRKESVLGIDSPKTAILCIYLITFTGNYNGMYIERES